MFAKTLFFVILFISTIFGDVLEKDYYIDSDTIYLKDVLPSAQDDRILYSMEQGKYTKRVKAKELIAELKKIGYNNFTSQSNYIKFTKKSPIDTSFIKKYIEQFYTNTYSKITIENIFVEPRNFLPILPKQYTIHIKEKDVLSQDGSLYIKTNEQKKIFFEYKIKAKIEVYIAKNSIKRGTELSLENTLKKSIILEKLKALPIQINKSSFENKIYLKKGDIITINNIESLHIVKRDTMVHTTLEENGIVLSFSAKADSDAKIGDIITLTTQEGKKVKVKVIGKNIAKVL